MLTSCYLNCATQDSLTPKERKSAQEVNALGLPVTIHLEDQMIPLPQAYAAAGNSEVKNQMAEGNGLWRTDTDGDIAKWLNNGFTPRAGGGSPALQITPPCCSVIDSGMQYQYRCIANRISACWWRRVWGSSASGIHHQYTKDAVLDQQPAAPAAAQALLQRQLTIPAADAVRHCRTEHVLSTAAATATKRLWCTAAALPAVHATTAAATTAYACGRWRSEHGWPIQAWQT